MSLMAANEESDPSAILNDFWVTLCFFISRFCLIPSWEFIIFVVDRDYLK